MLSACSTQGKVKRETKKKKTYAPVKNIAYFPIPSSKTLQLILILVT